MARLLAEAGCDIVGKAADASQLMELVAEVQPDVARLIKADVGLRVATVDVGAGICTPTPAGWTLGR